ncbi:TPA: hypothetical protein HA265_04650 [Candidatus Woesearchaeota archaeon]|nr:hypothetical protein [Candidatus Woesearchaeota archaeon]
MKKIIERKKELKGKKTTKTQVYVQLTLAVLLALGLVAAAIPMLLEGKVVLPALVAIAGVVLAIGFFRYGLNQLKNVKQGLPLEDERSKKVRMIAASKAFHASFLWLLVLFWVTAGFKLVALNTEELIGAAIFGMAILFGIAWVWVDRQENLD